jgi:hypothetical protein
MNALSDFTNFVSETFVKFNEIFTKVDANRLSEDCSKFNDLIENLNDVRMSLLEYKKFRIKHKTVYDRACLDFQLKTSSVTTPLISRFNNIKLTNYVNMTEFIVKDIAEVGELIEFARKREKLYTRKLCFDCKRTQYYDPSMCLVDRAALDTDVQLSDQYLTYLEAFQPYMAYVGKTIPPIFNNFAKCPTKRSPKECPAILTSSLQSLELYLNLLNSMKSEYDLLIGALESLGATSLQEFVDVQKDGYEGRSAYLKIEAEHLQFLYNKFEKILFDMM